MSNNSVSDFEDFKAKIRKERLPTGFSIIDNGDQLMFFSFEIVPHEGPKVAKSLTVNNDLSFMPNLRTIGYIRFLIPYTS